MLKLKIYHQTAYCNVAYGQDLVSCMMHISEKRFPRQAKQVFHHNVYIVVLSNY
jgi:hypothetical protein